MYTVWFPACLKSYPSPLVDSIYASVPLIFPWNRAVSRHSSAARSCRIRKMPGSTKARSKSVTRSASTAISPTPSRCGRWRGFGRTLCPWRRKRKGYLLRSLEGAHDLPRAVHAVFHICRLVQGSLSHGVNGDSCSRLGYGLASAWSELASRARRDRQTSIKR